MPETHNHTPPAAASLRLAITGMDVIYPGCPGLASFERLTLTGAQVVPGAPVQFDLNQAETDFWQIPPVQASSLDVETALLLKLAARLGLAKGSASTSRRAFFFARGLPLVSAMCQRLGIPSPVQPVTPSFGELLPGAQVFDLSLQGCYFAAALHQAHTLLTDGLIDEAVLAGTFLPGALSALLAKAGVKSHEFNRVLGFDRTVDGWSLGSGAAALSLMLPERAAQSDRRVYATVQGLGYATRSLATPKAHLLPTFVSSDTVLRAAQLAYEQTGLSPAGVGYLDCTASGFAPVDAAEMGGLSIAYQGEPDLSCAVGSVQANTGYVPSVAGLSAVIRTALCLYNRAIPAVPGWSGPKKPERWEQTPFYVAPDPRAWFQPRAAGPRLAAVSVIGWDGSCAHALLAEPEDDLPRFNQVISSAPFVLLPVAGETREDLLQALSNLRDALQAFDQPAAAASTAFQAYQAKSQAAFTAAITGSTMDELRREIDLGLRDIPAAFDKGRTWQTPQGSVFAPTPLGQSGGVAFVYPGAFNSYLGLGRDLFQLYPQIYSPAARLTADLGGIMMERLLFPRSREAFSKEQLQEIETALNTDPIAMITSGSLISVLYTMVLRDVYKIQPAAAFGYSLGEIGMLFASGIWDLADQVSANLRGSPLFHRNLAGPQNAVRTHWGLPELDAATDQPIWANYFLMTNPENALRAVEAESRVYLTHINTPRQVVIGGDPQACQRVVAALKCTSLRAPFDFALHCQAIESQYAELTRLLHWPVAHVPSTRLYTAAGFEPLALEPGQVSAKISRMLCSRLDFPGLVRQVYDSGARVFVELGANANCSKWIEDILKTEPAVSAAINRKGVDDHTSIVRLLARLVSQRVALDLSPLYA